MGDCGPIDQAADTFRYSDLVVVRNDNPKAKPALDSSLKFGTCFTDHMLLVEHVEGEGWGKPAIVPFGPLSIHPAATSLHYGMGCFEGMKAYAGTEDGLGRLFRPDMNMARLQRSTRRLMLADFDPQECLECLKALLRVDRAWLPEKEGFSLYIRPLVFSSSTILGVAPTARTTLNITLSVAGPYFSSGLQPISLFIEEQSPRAWPGGVGSHKIASNYAPTIAPQVAAREAHGAAQVVYTTPGVASRDPEDAGFSECGVMNMFFLFELPGGTRELATPPLDGTILPGVTRDSILQLAAAWGEFAVTERHVTVREAKAAAEEGRLLEVFGAGTSCLAQPVSVLLRANGDAINVRQDTPSSEQVVTRILHEIVDVQYGRRKDHPWSVTFEDAAQK